MSKATINVEWPAVPGATGYDISNTDPSGLAHLSNTKAQSARFGVYEGSKVKISVRQAQPVPPPVVGVDLPTREHHLVGPSSIACREDYASPVTGPRTRWWEFDPNFHSAPAWVKSVGNLGREVWIIAEFAILAGGYCGRIIDGHSEVSDTDIQDHAVPPAPPGGAVSAFSIDHGRGVDEHSGGPFDGIVYTCEPEGADHGKPYHWQIIPAARLAPGSHQRLGIHLTLGRRGTSIPGAIQIWDLGVAGNPQVWDIAGISTIWGNQSVMHFLQGPYNFGATAAVQMAANRFGRTEAEARADVPVYTGAVAGRGPSDFSIPVTPGWPSF